MENIRPDFNSIVFYSCGVCNLKCRYCNIDKNPALKQIDKDLEESFKGDYYINQVKKYLPRPDMLRVVELWGGEPFLHMDRVHNVVRQLIDFYPYYNYTYSSTNFAFDTWTDQLFGLFDVFGEYPDRYFRYCLQLSIDGPEEMNDAGRGVGTTKKCLSNFNKMVELLKNNRLPKNLNLEITIKGTLDTYSIKELLDKNKIINYYKFLEDNYIEPIRQLNMSQVALGCHVPNMAVPSPATVEDGKIFADFIKLCREIESENKTKKYFKYYDIITPYHNTVCSKNLSYKGIACTCGSGTSSIGFLPNNMISTCHEGFTQLAKDYITLATVNKDRDSSINLDKYLEEQEVPLCMTEEEYKVHMYKMSTYMYPDSTSQLATSTATIMALAMAGQIESQYLDERNALEAAIFAQKRIPFCIKDNYNRTGSYTMQPIGLYKLFFNGAKKYMENEGDINNVG